MNYPRTQIIKKDPKTGRDILFDSIMEKEYYDYLCEREARGEVSNIECHPEYVLQEPFIYFGKKVNAVVYTPDFIYYDNEKKRYVAIEVKGIPTPDFELRLKLWKYRNPNIEIFVVTKSKSVDWLEVKEYRKAMKAVKREREEERAERKYKEKREKSKRKIERLEGWLASAEKRGDFARADEIRKQIAEEKRNFE